MSKSVADNNSQQLDAVIIGGGIAGLFTLARLLDSGYQAVLIEKENLGAKQTLASQGIIHGGTKYSLLGKKTNAQKQIAEMPNYWRRCLVGQKTEEGEVDLSAVKVLCDKQLMWARNDISSKVTGFFASRAMQSKVQKADKNSLPDTLQHPQISGNFYFLDEPVLAVDSLMEAFVERYADAIYQQTAVQTFDKIDTGYQVITDNNTFNTKKIILTAGQANQSLASQLGVSVSQQLRPLRMVNVNVPKSYGALFLHILEMSDKPRLTISSKPCDAKHYTWYLGGNLAEKGVQQSDAELITTAKSELTALFPWLDFTELTYSIVDINRAEGTVDGKRPDTPVLVESDNVIVGWPTKLAMAPVLAEQILQTFKS